MQGYNFQQRIFGIFYLYLSALSKTLGTGFNQIQNKPEIRKPNPKITISILLALNIRHFCRAIIFITVLLESLYIF